MTLALEAKKLKRTGYFPSFLAGGLLASAFPLVNMLVRAETFTALPGEPFSILMDANWQMMAMLNILVCICGACMMFHTEYADNGAQKMDVLPVRAGNLFLTKFVIAALALALMAAMETAVLAGCAVHWFPGYTFDISVGIGLASIVPSVLMINTEIWFAYPMSYPFYLLMVEYGRSAAGVYESQIAWLPWLPAAVSITVIALGIACMRFGAAERR